MRQMSGMALHAIDLSHLRDVGLVALLTLHGRTVLASMTRATIKLGMFVGILLVQPLLIVMTGETDRLDLWQVLQIHFQRLMRIVTSSAVFYHEMPPLGA
jgi:hypothetical protein